jgi:hypothetical protein
VPLAWFVPFAGAERWVALGEGAGDAPPVARTLVYVAQMSHARHRVARGLAALRRLAEATAYGASCGERERASQSPGCGGPERSLPAGRDRNGEKRRERGFQGVYPLDDTETDLAAVGRWLEEFHPYSLVELDYGGLVYLLTDDALYGDESVAELAAAIDGMSRGHCELAIAMYSRAHARWLTFKEFEQVN